MKTIIVALSIVSLGLTTGLFLQHQKASQALATSEEARASYSNSWQQAKAKLDKFDE